MQLCEVLHTEASCFAHDQRERVTDRQHGRGARARSQVVLARFATGGEDEGYVGGSREGAVASARDGDQACSAPADERKNANDLFRRPAVRKEEHHIVGTNASQVAMDGLGGM